VRRSVSRFAFGPRLVLEIRGRTPVRKHFRAEYGAAPTADGGDANVVIRFGGPVAGPVVRYKTVNWRIALGRPTERPLHSSVKVGGRPLSFVLSLLQGYLVEPLLGVAAARERFVLLPSAAIEADGGAVLLLGRSRSGKSSLCARALAAGGTILGDDHVLLDQDGRCFAFPRRLRVYSDLEQTAPEAFARLPRRSRSALAARAAVRTLSGGFVAPPLRLRVEDLGKPFSAEPLPLVRVVAIGRDEAARDLTQQDLPFKGLIELAEMVTDEQRRHLVRPPNAGEWAEALAVAREADREVLTSGFRDVPAQAVMLPAHWSAPRSVGALAGLLGIDR
jgi:hypothetical protein